MKINLKEEASLEGMKVLDTSLKFNDPEEVKVIMHNVVPSREGRRSLCPDQENGQNFVVSDASVKGQSLA